MPQPITDPNELPQPEQTLQVNPFGAQGDYGVEQERKDIALYHRGITIQRQGVQIQALTRRVQELERERDGLKAQLEQKKEPTEMRKAS